MPRESIHEFLDTIESGIGHKTCLSLRKLLIANSNKVRGKLKSRETFAIVIHAMINFHNGVELGKMQLPKKFPYKTKLD